MKPISGAKFEKTVGENDIDVEAFFGEIEHYKSEFAFRLVEQMKATPNVLNLPDYIKSGFEFLMKEKK